jgi:protein TonB
MPDWNALYPESSTENCEEGNVQVRLSIDEHGKVVDVKLEKSSGYPALDNVVLANIGKSRFSPARTGGKPVPYEQTYVFKFQLRDANKRAYDECRKAGRVR